MTPEQLDLLGRTSWGFVACSAAAGVVTMGLVQLAKDLLPIRTMWQKAWIQGVVQRLAQEADPRAGRTGLAYRALDELLQLAVGGQEKALYGLPIDRLAGQLSAAAQAVLDYPARHESLFRILATGSNPDDVDTLLRPPPSAPLPGQPMNADSQAEITRTLDARNRVSHQVQRNLDALQINMGFRWRLYMQLMSVAVGGVLAAGMMSVAKAGPLDEPMFVGGVGLLGGFLASVGWDVVSAFQANRGRG
jgi:hypothetical protein